MTYRGVKIGKVSRWTPTRDGVTLDLALEEGTELPSDSPMYVHNLSAVGEQYLDFEPADDEGPYAEDGDVLDGSRGVAARRRGRPARRARRVRELGRQARTSRSLIRELGDMFEDTGPSAAAAARQRQHASSTRPPRTPTRPIRCSTTDSPCCRPSRTRARTSAPSPATWPSSPTSLEDSDADLRTMLDGHARPRRASSNALLSDLEPTLPVLLANATSVNQVGLTHLAGLEQLLVIFPR